jgi:hypothetical protein
MRKSKRETEETRKRIVEMAADEFRQRYACVKTCRKQLRFQICLLLMREKPWRSAREPSQIGREKKEVASQKLLYQSRLHSDE